MTRRQPALKQQPFVFAEPEHGRMVVKDVSIEAAKKGVRVKMVVADARAILPQLQVFDYEEGRAKQLLSALAEWFIRFTPIVAIDLPDGLMLDVSGCAHLWGGEIAYLKAIKSKLLGFGYSSRIGMADTIGAAWANARFGQTNPIIEPEGQKQVILPLSSAALRIDTITVQKLEKLGLYRIADFIEMPRPAMRRRFGALLLQRLDQALGYEIEMLSPVEPIEPYEERLPCLEPIRTAPGIEIAITKLLTALCKRFEKEDKGLRTCTFKGYRIDGNIQQISIGTSRPSRNVEHLLKLFTIKLPTIEPALGIELFVLHALIVEDLTPAQEALWNLANNHDEAVLAELLDKLAGKIGAQAIKRYLPQEHYWPERSIRLANSLDEQPETDWRSDSPRPILLLPKPEPIEVMVQIPDYPPVLFHYKKQVHRIKRADGPERIEQEWWIENGLYRDYYCVEDEEGRRYWLFRSGSYEDLQPKWYLHGFFA